MGTHEEILGQQKESWNGLAPVWKKWDEFIMAKLGPVGDALIQAARLKLDARILDVATGTGEPGLTAAKLVPRGSVVGVDLSGEMVNVAQNKASVLGIGNFQAQTVDGGALPFGPDSFDTVICRFGVMFFPDPLLTLKDMVRVLKPGGSLVLATWAPGNKNTWITGIAGTVNTILNLPAPPADGPGMFRFADPAVLSALLGQAGLKEASVTECAGSNRYESIEQWWNFTSEIAHPVVMALESSDQATRDRIKAAVVEKFQGFVKDGELVLPWSAWIGRGVK